MAEIIESTIEEQPSLVNVLVITNENNEKVIIEYLNVWSIENNGLDLFLDPNKYNVNDLSDMIPSTIFNATLAVKDVENSDLSYHSNLTCRSISLNKERKFIQVTLPGLTEEAKKYLELQHQIEQLQANMDYLAMETDIELEV